MEQEEIHALERLSTKDMSKHNVLKLHPKKMKGAKVHCQLTSTIILNMKIHLHQIHPLYVSVIQAQLLKNSCTRETQPSMLQQMEYATIIQDVQMEQLLLQALENSHVLQHAVQEAAINLQIADLIHLIAVQLLN